MWPTPSSVYDAYERNVRKTKVYIIKHGLFQSYISSFLYDGGQKCWRGLWRNNAHFNAWLWQLFLGPTISLLPFTFSDMWRKLAGLILSLHDSIYPAAAFPSNKSFTLSLLCCRFSSKQIVVLCVLKIQKMEREKIGEPISGVWWGSTL